jgi:hypothetical protein
MKLARRRYLFTRVSMTGRSRKYKMAALFRDVVDGHVGRLVSGLQCPSSSFSHSPYHR